MRKRNIIIAVRDYVRKAEPEVLRKIGMESKRKGTDKLTSAQIQRIVRAARASKSRSR